MDSGILSLMKVILLRDVKGVGRKFEEKQVSDGYAANFLIPKKFAVPADGPGAGSVKVLKEQEERIRTQKSAKLETNVAKLANKTLNFKMSANEKGHLFASINREKLSKLLKEQGIEIDADCLVLEHAIKETGTFSVPVSLGSGKSTHFTLEITPL